MRQLQSFLGGILPINKNSWADHSKKMEVKAKMLVEAKLDCAALTISNFNFQMVSLRWTALEELEATVVDVGVTTWLPQKSAFKIPQLFSFTKIKIP